MSFTQILACRALSLSGALMTWAGLSLEAASSFEILRPLFQEGLSPRRQLPARSARGSGLISGEQASES